MAIRHGSGGWFVKATGIKRTMGLLEQLGVQFEADTLWLVGPQVHYAKYHELGTYKMAARPFMRPAAERVNSNIGGYARRVAGSQGIELDSFDSVARSVALAVEDQAKRIARAKDVHKTGDLIASIEARRG